MYQASEILDFHTNSFSERDLPAFLELFSDDAVIRGFDGSVLWDRRTLEQQFGQLFSTTSSLRMQVVSRFMVGEYVVQQEEIDGFQLAGWPSHVSRGVIYRVSDELIRGAVLVSRP